MRKCVGFQTFPKIWNGRLIIPISKEKTGGELNAGDYRPISLMTVMGKVLDEIINSRIDFHMKKTINYEKDYNNQYGFREGKSTIDAISRVEEQIKSIIEGKEYGVIVSLDIKAAFDRARWAKIIEI